MIKKYEWLIYIIVILLLCIIYFSCFNATEEGYGYPGHRGYHHHSFWYIRHYDESFNASNRENSAGGNRFSQRGLSGGK